MISVEWECNEGNRALGGAAERYLELADMMEAHRNDAVSALFRDMVHYSRLHHAEIVERARCGAARAARV